MKTLVCLIAVLAITAPVLATTITIVGETDGTTLTLKYYADGVVRGVALALSCSNDATTNDAGTTEGANWNVCLDHAYDVVTAEGTYNLGDGGPLAKSDGPGVPTGNVSDFSICVGMVDESGAGGGVPQGSQGAPEELCTIVLDVPGSDSTVTVTEDTLRGGAVGSPVTIQFDMNGDGTPGDNTTVVEGTPVCGDLNAAELAIWNGWGNPPNWCGDCWREGDVDGDCAITFADVQMVNGDYLNPTTPEALTGRSDNDMDTAITFADVQKVNSAYLNNVLCPEPCAPLP
jgi:hypothetical protein